MAIREFGYRQFKKQMKRRRLEKNSKALDLASDQQLMYLRGHNSNHRAIGRGFNLDRAGRTNANGAAEFEIEHMRRSGCDRMHKRKRR
jgi:hypothetical protein